VEITDVEFVSGEVVKNVLQEDTSLMSWHLWGWGHLSGGPRSCIQLTCWHTCPHDGKRGQVLWLIIFLLICRPFQCF